MDGENNGKPLFLKIIKMDDLGVPRIYSRVIPRTPKDMGPPKMVSWTHTNIPYL